MPNIQTIRKTLCIDLFCGLGGWADGFIAEGWDVIGFDITRHVYGDQRYPGQLVLQDALTLHGSQFRNADCIVASPPCQRYSWMAMPWSLAKREVAWQNWERSSPFGDRGGGLNALFAACLRIQREASEAAGRHIPMVIENVKGAQPWVGRAAWHFGSFYLWGDVPALMPITIKHRKVPGFNFHQHEKTGEPGGSFQSAAVAGMKTVGHANIRDGHTHTRHLTNQRESDALKVPGISWSGHGKPGYVAQGFNVTAAKRWREEHGPGVKCPGNDTFQVTGKPCGKLTDPRYPSDGVKIGGSGDDYWRKPLEAKRREATAVKNGGDWFGSGADSSEQRKHNSKSDSRKAASAMIAKIPFELSSHIARHYKP